MNIENLDKHFTNIELKFRKLKTSCRLTCEAG